MEQFVQEGHLRWDSLGEYLATAISFEELSMRTGNKDAKVSLLPSAGRPHPQEGTTHILPAPPCTPPPSWDLPRP